MDNTTVDPSQTFVSTIPPDPENVSPDQAANVLANFFKAYNSWLTLNQSSGNLEQYVFTVDLSAARAETAAVKMPFAFRSVFVRDASDNNAYLYLKPYSNDTQQGSSKLRNNTLWESDDVPCPACWLWWDAQPGKQLILEFHVRSRVVPGNTQQTSYVTEGSSANTTGSTPAVGNTAAILLAADPDRKVSTVQNQGTASIFVGDSTVTVKGGTSPGIEVPAGSSFQWKNTGELYAIASVASVPVAILTEK